MACSKVYLFLLHHSLEIVDENGERGEQAVLETSQPQAWESTILRMKLALAKAEEDFEGNSVRGRIRSLIWPFSKEDTLKLADELSRHKATVNVNANVDSDPPITPYLRVNL